MKCAIEDMITAAELVGGAVAPPTVLAMCSALRKYAGLAAEMAMIIHDGCVTGDQMDRLCDRMADARVVELPDMPGVPVRSRERG